jgi:hypothetical protein
VRAEVHGREGLMPLAQLIGALTLLARRDMPDGVHLAL